MKRKKDSGCGCGSESAKELLGNDTNDDSGCDCGVLIIQICRW